jgi:predicted metallopeptidase
MSKKYEYSESLQVLAEDIARRLFPHVPTSRIKCFRNSDPAVSFFAKCHCLDEIMQKALSCDALYVLEFGRENFDDLETEKKVKVVIGQLMNISEKFGRGFREKGFVTKEKIVLAYEKYLDCRRDDLKVDFLKELK